MPKIDRVVAILVIAITVGFVWALSHVTADGRGHGTHEQFGMPVCSWPLPAPYGYGIPCPTCGCTTAAAQLVQLSPIDAIATQPFGAAVAGAGVWLAIVAMLALLRRESFVERIARWHYATITLVGIALLLVAWFYKYMTWPSAAAA